MLEGATTEGKRSLIEQERNDVIEKVAVSAEEVVEHNAVSDLDNTETNASNKWLGYYK